MNIAFKGIDKSSCLPKLKSITVLLYDFFTMNEKFSSYFYFCCWSHVQHKQLLLKYLM